jgi:ferredoxin
MRFYIISLLHIASSFSPSPARTHSYHKINALITSSDYNTENETPGSSASSLSKGTSDMNRYNLPFDQAVEEWTANMKAASDLEDSGVYLGAKSFKEIFVDNVQISFPRRRDAGMGILLEEIAGGREDGLGITIVSGLVEGGAADKSGILPGDCISSIAIRDITNPITEATSIVSVECLGYDATVDAILSLPAMETTQQEENEMFVLSIKRLRRKPRVNVTIQYPPDWQEPDITLQLFSGENLRRAMLTRGVKLNDALSRRFDSGGSGDCGAEGTCATCVVSVLKGGELLNPQGIQEQQMLQKNPRWRLGCKAIVGYKFQEGDISLRVNPRQWKS